MHTDTATPRLSRSSRDVPEVGSAPRREIKFALLAADHGKLTSILRTNFRRVRHGSGSGPSIVRSIYFDDERLSSLGDSVEGVGRRCKLRLRWYNDDERTLFYEAKIRTFEIVAKRRVPIDSEVPVCGLDYRALSSELRALLEPRDRALLARYARPVVLVEYARDYYEGDGVRLTVDTDLKWVDQLGAFRPRRRFGVGSPRLVVLEVKLPPSSPFSVAELLRPLCLAPSRSSKYVMGCERLGMLRG